MTDTQFTIIEELITQNENVKQENRKLISLCEDILDNCVDLFKQFFPSIQPFDSDCIFKAGQAIFGYYKKQLFLYKAQLTKNLFQIINLYDIEIDGENGDLQQSSLDNWDGFISIMKSGKGGIKKQLWQKHLQIEKLESIRNILEKAKNEKQLQYKKISIEFEQKIAEIIEQNSTIQLLKIENSNYAKLLLRSKNDVQLLETQFKTIESELQIERKANQDLRRQIITLEKERIQSYSRQYYIESNK